MLVRDIMTRDPRTMSPDDSLETAARAMNDNDVGVLPIMQNGKLRGVITDRDITVRGVARGVDVRETPVRSLASRTVTFCYDDQSIEDATTLMQKERIRRLPVLGREDDRLVGMLTLCDMARQNSSHDQAGAVLREVSRPRSR